jgi:eukaryotic-like serine/threonine-protein kinase
MRSSPERTFPTMMGPAQIPPIPHLDMTSTLLPSPPAERPDDLVAEIVGSRYRIERSIAAGGTGEVFLATDSVLERRVAVKILHRNLSADPGFVERFRREARAAAGLNHPNVVAVHDWGESGRTYYMVMEYVPGASLREVLGATGRLEAGQATDILGQVLQALDHAHRRGIVHRDLKPENIVLTPDGRAKVADFGLARAYLNPTTTRTLTVIGTPEYLAPEQVSGEPVDPRSDLYSLGIVAFELLVGDPPFSGPTPFAVANMQLQDPVPLPSAFPGVGDGLDAWIQATSQKDRAHRPASAADALKLLERTGPHVASGKSLGALVARVNERGADVRARVATVPNGRHADASATLPDRTGPVPGRATRTGRRRRGVAWLVVAVLILTATGAWAGWTMFGPHDVRIPVLMGRSIASARERLLDAGLRVHVAKGQYSSRLEKGVVQEVTPIPGTEVAPGSLVTLAYSLGPQPVPVPSVLGLNPEAARTILRRHHLRLGRVSSGYSSEYDRGVISAQSVPMSDTTLPNTAIDVTVSLGSRPFAMPNVKGMDAGSAIALLESKGLKVETDDTTFLGLFGTTVFKQDPLPGAEVVRGDVVKIYIY